MKRGKPNYKRSKALQAYQEKMKRIFSIIDLSPCSHHEDLDIFRRVMSDDMTVIPKLVAHEPIFYPQPILKLYLKIMIGWLKTDARMFEKFENPSFTFTRFVIISQQCDDERLSDEISKINKDLFDFAHLRYDDSFLVLSDRSLRRERLLVNFIKNAEPAVFALFSMNMDLTIRDLSIMDIARAYKLMEFGALAHIENHPQNTKLPEWLSPFPDDSDMVRLTKQHILQRPNLRLLHKLSGHHQNYRRAEIVVDCEKRLSSRFKKYRFWGKTNKPMSLVLAHMRSLQGYTSDLVDCPKDCISFLQDYLLIPFKDVRFDKNPSVLDMPLHLFETNEELIPLLIDSMKTTPLTPKLETIMDMCQYHVDYSLTQKRT